MWKEESGASVVRGSVACSAPAPATGAHAPVAPRPKVSTSPPGGLALLKEKVAQLRAELAVISGLQQEISALTALVNALQTTLAKVCLDLKLNASHVLVEAVLSAPPRPARGGTTQVPPILHIGWGLPTRPLIPSISGSCGDLGLIGLFERP